MKEAISFPHLGDYYIPIRKLLRNLTKMEVIPAPPITKKTIELGSKYAPDTVCVPFKYNLGNFIETLDEGATILFQAGGGCRYRYYAEVQEKILKDLGYKFHFFKLVSHDRVRVLETFRLFKQLNPHLKFRTFIKEALHALCFIYYMDKIDEIIRKNIGFEKEKNSFKNLKKEMLNEMDKTHSTFALWRMYKKYKKKHTDYTNSYLTCLNTCLKRRFCKYHKCPKKHGSKVPVSSHFCFFLIYSFKSIHLL